MYVQDPIMPPYRTYTMYMYMQKTHPANRRYPWFAIGGLYLASYSEPFTTTQCETFRTIALVRTEIYRTIAHGAVL